MKQSTELLQQWRSWNGWNANSEIQKFRILNEFIYFFFFQNKRRDEWRHDAARFTCRHDPVGILNGSDRKLIYFEALILNRVGWRRRRRRCIPSTDLKALLLFSLFSLFFQLIFNDFGGREKARASFITLIAAFFFLFNLILFLIHSIQFQLIESFLFCNINCKSICCIASENFNSTQISSDWIFPFLQY